jgi:hypothetical protein
MLVSLKAFLRGPAGVLAGAVSFFFTVLSVVQFLSKSGSAWMWLALAFAALLALSFWRFHEEHQGPSKEWAVKDLFGQSLTAGEKAVHDSHRPTVNAWRFHTRRLVVAALGEGEAARVFHSPPNATTTTLLGDRSLGPVELTAIYVGNLRDLIGKVGDPLSVRPDFSPKDWEPFSPEAFERTNARTLKEIDDQHWECPWCETTQSDFDFRCKNCNAEASGPLVFQPEPAG